MTSYDLTTSIPTYKNGTVGRDITQVDVDEINRIMDLYEINLGLERVRHFLAQCQAETDRGYAPIERYNGTPTTYQRFKNYEKERNTLGNIPGSGDGYKYRGGGAIQLTGMTTYRVFSEYIGDPKILSDGALYVGQKYFWVAAGFYWIVYKPYSADMDEKNIKGDKLTIYQSKVGDGNKYDLNGKCDGGVGVKTISNIVYGNADDPDCHLDKREAAYNYYKSVIK